MIPKTLSCRHVKTCGGCPWGQKTLSDQHQLKLAAVSPHFDNVRLSYTPTSRVRDRADLVWENGRLGLYSQQSNEIISLEECLMMSEPLELFFRSFKLKPPEINKGSVRLRVSPRGEKGVWLDFANADVKKLFEERDYLRWLSEQSFVEIGQRRKALVWRDGAPKLVDPILKPWFETYRENGEAIPLYSAVGSFSQAGFASNRALVDAVARAVNRSGLKSWVELFAGNGNLALALAARGMSVEAVELDELAVEGVKRSLIEQPDLEKRVSISRGDVYLKPQSLPSWSGKGLLVDPPRSGLRKLVDLLAGVEKPQWLVYVSCFTESFLEDTARLQALGYKKVSLEGVDQFPHSPHNEWVALFQA